MFKSTSYTVGLAIDAIATCDFARLESVSNDEVLRRAGREPHEKLQRFLRSEMGIARRYHAPASVNALDLARDALSSLLSREPELRTTAELLVFAGISSPMPTVCLAALLANELGLERASCWDLKSGCSTAVLALAQTLDWFQHGTRHAILVSSETFSKFTRPTTLEMAASTGDGACAVALRATEDWRVRAVVHGTDAAYFKSAYVPGTYPVDLATYDPDAYFFAFEGKPETLERLAHHWVESLRSLLDLAGIPGSRVTHYVAHQVDATKNRAVARACGIRDEAIALNFEGFGNMGSPTVLLNLHARLGADGAAEAFHAGDVLVLHAVGGGLSYAGICLEKVR